MKLTNLTYHSHALISAPKIHTDLLWDLTILFVSIAVVYFIAIFFFKKRISKRAKKTKALKTAFSPMISEFIFLEADATKDEKSKNVALKVEIRELLKNKFNRETVAEILLDLRKDVAGSAQKQLFELYKDLGLHKASYKKLRSWRWETVSQGIGELTKMQVAESYSFITRFINDKRGTIRKQAEMAVVTLKPEGLNYFLDTTKHRISEWQQLKLMEVLANKENYVPPSFKVWLTSKNKYVVLFALRLIKHYDQNDANTTIVELVKHKNNRIKKEAIDCINSFHVPEALETLKTVFWKCTPDIKIAILDAIGNIGSKEDINFLQLIENKEYSFSVRSKALASINMIAPETVMPTEGILDTEGYEVPKDINSKKLEVMEPENSLDEYVEASPEIPITPDEDAFTETEEVTTDTIDQIVDSKLPIANESPVLETQKENDEVVESVDLLNQIVENEPPSIVTEPTELEIQKEEGTILPLADLFDALVVDTTLVSKITEPTDNEVTHDKSETPTEMEDTPPLNDDAEVPMTNPEENTEFALDFIPLVVDESNVPEAVNESGRVSDEADLAELSVSYEEIKIPVKPIKEKESEVLRFDVTKADMYFIPVVTEDISIPIVRDEQEDSQEAETPEAMNVSFEVVEHEGIPSSIQETDIKELEVQFEEIRFEDSELEVAEVPLKEVPVVVEEITHDELTEPVKNQVMKALDLLELKVIYQEVQSTAFNGCWSLEELLEEGFLPSELSQAPYSPTVDSAVLNSLEEVLEAGYIPGPTGKVVQIKNTDNSEQLMEPSITLDEELAAEEESQLVQEETEETAILQESEVAVTDITETVGNLEEVISDTIQENTAEEEEKGLKEDSESLIAHELEEEETTIEVVQEVVEAPVADEVEENSEIPETAEEEEEEEIGTIELELTGLAEPIALETEIAEQELPNWLLEEIADPNVRPPNKEVIKTEGPEWEAKVPKMMDDIQYYLRYIPEPAIYDSDISETMQLLDNIEFFGDERELPLLEELMAKEKKEEAYERLQDIIARFRGNTQPTEDGIFKLTPPYSIFEEFFRHCDTESKLILLSEVTAVGDEKEVYFLERLLDDPEPKIRAMASETLATLKERLSIANPDPDKGQAAKIYAESEKMTNSEYQQLLNEMQIKPPVEAEIFEIDFELSPEGETYEDDVIRGIKETPDNGSSFLSIFRKFNTKSRPKRNG